MSLSRSWDGEFAPAFEPKGAFYTEGDGLRLWWDVDTKVVGCPICSDFTHNAGPLEIGPRYELIVALPDRDYRQLEPDLSIISFSRCKEARLLDQFPPTHCASIEKGHYRADPNHYKPDSNTLAKSRPIKVLRVHCAGVYA